MDGDLLIICEHEMDLCILLDVIVQVTVPSTNLQYNDLEGE